MGMEALYVGIGFVLCLVLGAVAIWALFVRGLQASNSKLCDEKSELSDDFGKAERELIELRERLKQWDNAHEQRLKVYEDAEKALTASFAAVSLTSLKGAQSQFAEIAEEVLKSHNKVAGGDLDKRQKAIDEMLDPMREKLNALDEHNRELEKNRAKAYGELMGQVRTLTEQHSSLYKETNRLVTALQSPGTAGTWGEMVLERVIEIAGLQQHQTFTTQKTLSNEEGESQRPDVLIQFPGDRCLIIDSKAPMKAYTEGVEADSEDDRSTLFTAHAKTLHDHSKELKRRDYSQHDGMLDFTVMFVPSESAFRVAIDARPALIEEAMANNVVLASPTTLLALLRVVEYGWRQEQLAEFAKQIQKDGANLYNAICTLSNHYLILGKALKSTVTHYNSFGGSLEGNVLPAARRFKDQGVPSNKELVDLAAVEFEPRPLTSDEFDSNATHPVLEVESQA